MSALPLGVRNATAPQRRGPDSEDACFGRSISAQTVLVIQQYLTAVSYYVEQGILDLQRRADG